MNKPTLTLIFLCLICSVGYAQRQVYVATSAGTSGNGTPDNPYRTIREAVAAAQSGDVINLAAGVYHENVVVTKSNLRFKGEKDAGGNRLSIVDGSTRISGWQEGFADGVYYHEQTVEPWTLVLEENNRTYDIAKLIDEGKNFDVYGHTDEKYNTQTIFRFDSNYVDRTLYMGRNAEGVAVRYWDGIGALYYYRDDAIYLRFGDKRDPNDMIIRYAKDPVFLIKDQSNVTIQDLKLRGGVSGVEINGTEAKNNKVEGCKLVNGLQRVLIVNGASRNEIANNEMRMQGIAKETGGAWNGGENDDETIQNRYAINEHIYDVYKYEIGIGTGSPNEDCGIDLAGAEEPQSYEPAGDYNKIYNNEIAESLSAIIIRGNEEVSITGTEFYGNTVHSMSSAAIILRENTFETKIYDNLFYDVNFLSRLQELHREEPRLVFFYRNRLWNEPGIGGSAFYAYYSTNKDKGLGIPNPNTEVYIYHNSFAGGNRSISTSNGDGVVLENLYLVNNIFSTTQGPNRLNGVGRYDYNWCRHANDQEWYGPNNTFRPGEALWPEDARPDFRLSADDTAAIGTALNLTEAEVNQRILPGFELGYYKGEPDMGAIELGNDNPPTDPEPEPSAEPIEAAYASVPPERANSLDESYWAGITAYEFGDPTGDSDNRVAMKVVWNEQHLVIGVAVNDADLRIFDPTKPWRNDAIDLLFDPTNQQNLNWNPYTGPHRQLVMDVDRGQRSYPQGFGNAASPYLVKGKENYYREVRIPWTALTGKLPQAGDQVGFDIANHDRDSGGKTQFTYTQRTKEFLVPSQFTTLELRGPTTARTAESGSAATQRVGPAARQLRVYPNPSPTGSPRLRLSGFGQAQVQIVDTRGQVVYRGVHRESQIDLKQRFPRGLYVVRVSDTQGTLTKKLLIE